MIDLNSLKDFLDLGGTFILALVLLWCGIKKLDGIDDKLTRMLTLLAILTKAQTNFNGVDKVIGEDGQKVADIIIKAESEEKTSS